MEVICLEDKAFYQLIETVVERLLDKQPEIPEKWVNKKECMQILKITSDTTLQKLRDEGQVRFTQPQPKLILYDRASIDAYLEKHAKNTF